MKAVKPAGRAMRMPGAIFVVTVAAALIAGATSAQDLGARVPPKPSTPVTPVNVPDPDRQGGDAIINATVITEAGFVGYGTTAGYHDDYDAVCPYEGSTSPDVVYTFSPDTDVHVSIDLCGSSYDTKMYVLDSDLTVIACNDDYYFADPCGMYVSKLENVPVDGGGTYYLVIDGYGGDYGTYLLTFPPLGPLFCPVSCPDDGQAEGEPPLVEDYVDNHNGGCNTDPDHPFQPLAADANGELVLCGVSGWYTYQGTSHRDTDWYHLIMGPAGTVEVALEVEQDMIFFELGPHDCDTVGVLQQLMVENCDDATMVIIGYEPGAAIWFWAGPTAYTPPGPWHEFDYVCEFRGLEAGVMAEPATWSTLKALYD